MGIILFFSIYTLIYVTFLFLGATIYNHYYIEKNNDIKQLV